MVDIPTKFRECIKYNFMAYSMNTSHREAIEFL